VFAVVDDSNRLFDDTNQRITSSFNVTSCTQIAEYLVLDPHYKRDDRVASLRAGSALRWLPSSVAFRSDVFYNLLLPLSRGYV
jgi:hypothetical protein